MFCARGRQTFHYRALHWLFLTLSRAAENNNDVDSTRHCFFTFMIILGIHLKVDRCCISPHN
jgi:recombinational DNA repair protein (RecF pathway)